ncbi:MAG: lipoyl(octanoyl) transferase LipB [Candidatus Nanopelagicales bacterium]
MPNLDVIRQLDGRTPYVAGWEQQRAIHAEVVAGTRTATLLLVEHESVYTAGKRTQPADRPTDGSPVVDVDRGGRITWHGPGQLTGYPILTLPSPVDVMDYVHRLEAAIMTVCASLGITTERQDDRTGVWVPQDQRGPARKIAAIGVRVASGVTMHGFALNCNNALDPYHRIVPCGIRDAGVTTISEELGRNVGITDIVDPLVTELRHELEDWAR